MKTAREIIEGYDGPPVRIMEVCGTHTHEIFRLGIRKLLPEQVELISGPGCPVCVTQVGFIDEAIYLALERQVTICTFGDLVRVPGTNMSLAGAREKGAKIRIVYSPVDAKEYAKEHPKEQVTFLSVGFETTTPSACLSVKKAREEGLTNYSILTANKTMPQAYEALKGSADIFLYPGHVNAITGTKLCEELAKEGKQEEILEKLEEFLNTLDEVMTRVDTYLKDASEQVERDGDFLPELELSSVYQILKALAEFDMDEAEECLKELYKNRYAEDVEEVLEELKRYIEDLDYKHATSLLEDYLKKIG